MLFKKILLLLSSVLFIFACSSTNKQGSGDMDLTQSGFSLSLPEEAGWTVVKKGSHEVTLIKQGQTDGYTIQALVVTLPQFEGDYQFLEFIQDRMAASRKESEVISHQTDMYMLEGEQCVRYISKEQRESKNSHTVTLEVVSFTCRHPYNVNAGVYMALSKTYSQGTSSENLSEKALALFKRIHYTTL